MISQITSIKLVDFIQDKKVETAAQKVFFNVM